MKKLSLLILLALCVTIGGVYASWVYAEVATATKTNTETSLKVTDPITNTARGVLDIHNTLSLAIDDNSGNYKPEWDDAIDSTNGGNVVINFTPNKGLDAGEDGEIVLKVTFAITSGNTYVDHEGTTQNIFTYDEVSGEDASVFFALTKRDCSLTEKTTLTITYDQIVSALRVNDSFTVPTYADYQRYVEAVNATTLTLTVVEVHDPVQAGQ